MVIFEFNKFFHPEIGWHDVNVAEINSIGNAFYLYQLYKLGVTEVANAEGASKKLKTLISGLPFSNDDFAVYSTLLEDGWNRLTSAEAEGREWRYFLDVNGKDVQPLFKEFANGKCVFDLFGFNWIFKDQKFIYAAPVPF